MARHGFGDRQIVDITSDSEDDIISGDEFDFFDAEENRDAIEDYTPNAVNARSLANYEIADGDFIDLTGIPDIDVPPSDPPVVDLEAAGNDDFDRDDQIVSEADGLQMVLDFLPGISIDHVLRLLREKTTDLTRTNAHCRNLITQLVEDGEYPKEDDEKNKKKRKRSDEDDWKDFEAAERDPEIPTYESDASNLLKDEFPTVPVRHITNTLKQHKTLFKAYVILEEQVRNYKLVANQGFSTIAKARIQRGIEPALIERGSQLPKELEAAKKKIENDMAKRRKIEEAEEAEAQNLRDAQENGQMGECACCFDDVPLNRMISCNGDIAHSYCLLCPKRQIETQMGLSKCRPTCFGVDDCEGTFARKDLQRVLGDTTFERLEHLQQQQDLAAAGLDFLSECPFCDFKMECLPVDVDKEFRCQNKKCGKTSCRLCDKETHVPLTCKESEKDGQINLRHIVEEAMSAALIRHCNRCKQPFVKEQGCNKMTCSHCRNVQCYVCSKDVVNYEHFGQIGRGRCPLHEDIENRHEQEVKKAADEAMAKVRADNPGISDADLMIQVSDQVKKAEDTRKEQAQAEANAFPYHMVDDQLQRRLPPGFAQQGQQPARARGPVNQPAHFDANIFPFNHLFGQFQAQPQPYQQLPQPQPQQAANLQQAPNIEAHPAPLGYMAEHIEHGQQRYLQMQQAHLQLIQRQQQDHQQRMEQLQQANQQRRQQSEQQQREQRRHDHQQRRELRREQRIDQRHHDRLERVEQEHGQQGQPSAGQPGAGQPQGHLQAPLPPVQNVPRVADNVRQRLAEMQRLFQGQQQAEAQARGQLLRLRLNERRRANGAQGRGGVQIEDNMDLYEEPARVPRRAH